MVLCEECVMAGCISERMNSKMCMQLRYSSTGQRCGYHCVWQPVEAANRDRATSAGEAASPCSHHLAPPPCALALSECISASQNYQVLGATCAKRSGVCLGVL